MKLHHMRHFDAVARHASLHAAARALGVAQSALSRSIRELEQDLGVPLILRTARGVDLTAAGRRFLVRARTIQAEIAHSRDEAAQAAGAQGGSLSVGLSPTAQLMMLPAMLQRFRRLWPEVRLSVIEGQMADLQPGLLDGTLDFYVGATAAIPLHPSLRRETLADLDRIVVCRPGHPALGATTLAQLDEYEWIDVHDIVADAHDEEARRGRMQAPTMLSALLLLNASDALALVPRPWARAEAFAALLHVIEIDETLPRLRIDAVRRAALPLTPAAQFFYDAATRLIAPDGAARPVATRPSLAAADYRNAAP